MCSLAGYAGKGYAQPFLYEALKSMEYRGYDSYGFFIVEPKGDMYLSKSLGRLPPSFETTNLKGTDSHVGIAHTRWATHGKVTLENTHPIYANIFSNSCYIVHNGNVENVDELKEIIKQKSIGSTEYKTDTDTEVLGNLLSLKDILDCLSLIKGDYAFIILFKHQPDRLYAACRNMPLYVSKEGHIVSEPTALPSKIRFQKIENDTLYEVRSNHVILFKHHDGRWFTEGRFTGQAAEKVEAQTNNKIFAHAMLKEIHEQKTLLQKQFPAYNNKLENVCLFGCGSSYNVALLARTFIENCKKTPVHVEYASEFKNHLPSYPKGTGFLAISQSGETKDVIDTIKSIQEYNNRMFGNSVSCITNNPTSSIPNLSNINIFIDAGKEYGVAATKTFTCTFFALLAVFQIPIPKINIDYLFEEAFVKRIKTVAKLVSHYKNVLVLGRGNNYAVAREGCLKLKEVGYIHAEAMPAAEMKHGPLALIDDDTLCIFLVGQDDDYRIYFNIKEVAARDGKIVKIGCESDSDVVLNRSSSEIANIIDTVVVLQLLSYYVAVEKGIDPDYPKNLAKCCTVE